MNVSNTRSSSSTSSTQATPAPRSVQSEMQRLQQVMQNQQLTHASLSQSLRDAAKCPQISPEELFGKITAGR